MSTPSPDRRTVLRRAAVLGAGVWTVPVIQSITNPAAAGSAAPASEACLKQVFSADDRGRALTYTPGQERNLPVDVNATFSAISMIWVRLFPSASDPVAVDEWGSVRFLYPDGGSAGVIFNGGANPIVMGFGPGAGRGSEPYADLFLDGEGTVIVAQSSTSLGTFSFDRVEVEICGTLA